MIIVVDTETGGTGPGVSPLLSISACHLHNPENNFTVFIDPEPDQVVEPAAAEVNGYTPELWRERGAVPLLRALGLFKKWLPYKSNAPLAHNAPFDKSMIEAAERRAGFNLYLQKRWRCSMSLFMGVNDALNLDFLDFRLETLARASGHWSGDFQRGAHQSIDDVKACAAGWQWLMEKIRMGAGGEIA